MKRCSRCEREIPETATTCGQCDAVSAAPVPAAPPSVAAAAPIAHSAAQPAAPSTSPALPPAAPAAARGTNRRVVLAALLVLVGGTLTFAMLTTSTPPAVPVVTPAATPRPSAARPAAPKPTAPAAAPAATAPVAPIVTTKWAAANREWLLNAKKGVAFELRALNKVTIWQGIAQPMLVVRCDAGRMQMFVYTASAIQMEAQDENHTVRISFDDEAEVIERWADSSDHDALFAPDAAAFARRVTTARTLRFSYTPHNAPRVVAEFPVSGLGSVIEPAAKPCGWKK